MAIVPNGERVVAFKGDSLESLAGLIARGLTSSFDAIYVDASHEVSEKGKHCSPAPTLCLYLHIMPVVGVVADTREVTRSAVRNDDVLCLPTPPILNTLSCRFAPCKICFRSETTPCRLISQKLQHLYDILPWKPRVKCAQQSRREEDIHM